MDAILVKNLRRVFKSHEGILKRKPKDIVAVEDVSFEIRQGELFGLLGPNRAGKTATVKILTTPLIPSTGNASILGMDVVREAEQVRPRLHIARTLLHDPEMLFLNEPIMGLDLVGARELRIAVKNLQSARKTILGYLLFKTFEI